MPYIALLESHFVTLGGSNCNLPRHLYFVDITQENLKISYFLYYFPLAL